MFIHSVLNSTKINYRYSTTQVVLYPSNSDVLFKWGTLWFRDDKMDSE
jgi:hypothetical protein